MIITHLPTGDLRTGDVVLTHGMRVLLDEEPAVYSGRYSSGASLIPLGVVHPDDVVYAYSGTVLNLDEVRAARHVPMSFLHQDAPQSPNFGRRDVWTVQGNGRARWTVER